MASELRRSASSQNLPPAHVGATGSILSLLDRDVPVCSTSSGVKGADAAAVDAPSSWLDRSWMRSSRRKSSNGRDSSQKKGVTLETVAEIEAKVPKWKQFLRKLMRDVKAKSDGSKGSKSDGNSGNGNGQHAGAELPREKHSKEALILCKSFPPKKSNEKPANLLWERRNVTPVVALDLTNLKAARAKRYKRRALR